MYYKVLFDDDEGHGVAYDDRSDDLLFLPEHGLVEEWTPVSLRLRDGILSDYLANNIECRLCSNKLRNLIEKNVTSNDQLQWLPANVAVDESVVTYWILHFPCSPDVLDRKRSIFANNFVVKPVISERLAAGFEAFGFPGCAQTSWFVSDELKRILVDASISGVEFSAASK